MIYELCKIDRDISYNVISFPSILSAINTLAYKLAKISITFLKSPDQQRVHCEGLNAFAEKIVEQDSELFLECLLVYFINITPEETIDICTINPVGKQ